MLAYITGAVDQELLLRNEYLAVESRILRTQIKGRLLLAEAEKATLAEIAHRLGRKVLEELSAVAKEMSEAVAIDPSDLVACIDVEILVDLEGERKTATSGNPASVASCRIAQFSPFRFSSCSQSQQTRNHEPEGNSDCCDSLRLEQGSGSSVSRRGRPYRPPWGNNGYLGFLGRRVNREALAEEHSLFFPRPTDSISHALELNRQTSLIQFF
jgi:hypothetical protein